MEFFKGQRWLSETEPELGLGMVLSVDNRTLQLLFPTTDEVRTYTRDNPPLKRAKFLEGDSIETYEGQKLTVESIEEKDGLYFYVASGTEIPEAYLADSINMSMADRRLMNGRVDPSEIFDLRYDTLTHQCRIHKHPGYGYLGARIDLIPHQLYIAREVASRSIPRVMLADEVGLGKTIEACLILHRLYVRGLCGKVMIIVPEALIHQWFIELLRRFNMNFSIFNEERCNSMQQVNKDANPFDEEHLILTNLRFLMDNDKRLKEALEINWGLLIIDEAHHLQWTELEASAEYQAIEALSSKSKGLLLLTGTPEQFGAEGHFARLRLLDPARFNSLASYQEETQSYHETAERIQILIDKKILTDTDEKKIIPLIDGMKELEEQFKKFKSQDKIQIETAREFLINDLLDRYGTGRVVFRNTRAAIKGFPKRYAHGIPLKSKKDDSINWKEIANHEIAFELNEREHLKHHGNAAKDPRIDWLLEFIKKNKNEKILLICRYKDRAEALFEGISSRLNIKMTVFHEDLSLMQRDRNAAWFSDEDGAQLLLCSEIGSEGRNFQFAHHLVLFDLPLDPELLEQRIGRLDRIGQGSTIHLHVPYIKGTSQELLFRWFHEGINAFEEQVQGGALFVENFYSQLRKFLLAPENASEDFNKLIEDTSTFRSKLKDKLKRGRDRLLELQSFQPAKADEIIHELQQLDLSRELDRYLLNMFDHYGIHVEELSDRLWLLQRGQMLTDKLTLIPEQGKLITLQRSTAVKRDDVEFMTWDHPMLSSIADMMLGSDSGNASFVQVRASDCELSKDIFFEIIYVLEAVCPEGIDIKQFMPLTPFRIFCNHKNKSLSHSEASKLLEADKTDAPAQSITENLNIIKDMLRATTTYALELAEVEAASLRKAAQEIMQATYSYELDRMLALHQIKGTVNELEIKSLTEERKALDKGIDTSTIRMDSIRMYQII